MAAPIDVRLADAQGKITPPWAEWAKRIDATAGARGSGSGGGLLEAMAGAVAGGGSDEALAEVVSFMPAIPPAGPPAPARRLEVPFVPEADDDLSSEAFAAMASVGSPREAFRQILDALTAGRVLFVSAVQGLDDDIDFVFQESSKTLQITTTGVAPDAPNGTDAPQLHIATETGGKGQIYIDGYGTLGGITLRRAGGTQAAKTALVTNGAVFNLRGAPYTGATNGYVVGGLLRLTTNGNASDTNCALDFIVILQANGSTGTPTVETFRVTKGATIAKAVVNGAFGHQTGVGAGGTITQGSGSGKATGVTLDKPTGAITLDGAALAANTTVSFTFTNNQIEANDLVLVTHKSAGTGGAYTFAAFPGAGSATIYVRNVTAGSLSEAIVLSFSVIKGAIT